MFGLVPRNQTESQKWRKKGRRQAQRQAGSFSNAGKDFQFLEKGIVPLKLKERPDSQFSGKTLPLTSPLHKMNSSTGQAHLLCDLCSASISKGKEAAGMWGEKTKVHEALGQERTSHLPNYPFLLY